MSASGGAKYPSPVDFKDNQKDKKTNKDYCSIFLDVKGLKVATFSFAGSAKPSNAEVHANFQRASLDVRIEVKPKNGDPVNYEYRKSLPEDMDPDKSNWRAEKDTIILQLFKADGGSWNEHANYFIRQ
ncbi:hypothetical protein CAPTEDRAFT_220144 [Capitella teleta]|uniref:CS domain-containing protein n=1 Tax=Capitella teleta TaxID=283909 RepID=R7UKE0_CAPTE|nr:hypothetical protein CAPTEDRAFT_220144 [Capitella teleta]|eukprot:ELU06670.1 hypothetical protein CAPTEDRAFT_220144 [Capitella teleta]